VKKSKHSLKVGYAALLFLNVGLFIMISVHYAAMKHRIYKDLYTCFVILRFILSLCVVYLKLEKVTV
jgi:hypothetical protein